MASSIKVIAALISFMLSPYNDCSNLPVNHFAPTACVEMWLPGKDHEWYEVAYCESRFIPGSLGDRHIGGSYGLFQIHRRAHESTLSNMGYSMTDMYDPMLNVMYASVLYDQYNDWTHWTCKPTGDLEWRCSDENPRNRDGTNDYWHIVNDSESVCRDYDQ